MSNVTIVEYEARYKEAFQRLSYEWLEKYVGVEPEDERILNNHEDVILSKGGHIFFAIYGDEVVGTVSLIKVDHLTFELAKLAVTEAYQGLKIGEALMNACLFTARNEQASKIILYSNSMLKPAIRLYQKFNFVHIPTDSDKYVNADITMELKL
jgi:ribosomal protein S18 acetylase RimI-like enzyme